MTTRELKSTIRKMKRRIGKAQSKLFVPGADVWGDLAHAQWLGSEALKTKRQESAKRFK